MAQLPPKAPTMAQKWPSFGYQPPTWMDDFVDFSSSRRSSHRRSTSDPIAFIEPPPFINNEECRNSHANCSENNNGFERLDDEQLSSMFSDDFTASFSVPSDQNSDNDERKTTPPPPEEQQPPQRLKHEPGEVEDGCGYEHETDSFKPDHVTFSGDNGGTIIDPKRVKRILANRQSAQRSRVRKLHYISELERGVTNLQTEVSTLSPRVAFLDHQRLILNVDNSSLKQRIAALAQDKIFKDAHQEALKKEIERLRRVYHEQNMKKAENNTSTATTTGSSESTASPPPTQPATVNGTDEECE